MSKRIFKSLTAAQRRPSVHGCCSLHSAYLHTPLMCIAPWQSGAYALKRSMAEEPRIPQIQLV